MRFVLVHGWGFHAGIFADLIGHLDGAETTLIDLGFVSGGPKAESGLAVGRHCHRPFAGFALVAGAGGWPVQGPRQHPGLRLLLLPHRAPRIAALKRGLEREPGATLQAFWRSCGASGFALPEALNVARLDQGLDWLMHWDARKAKQELACPVLALAARDDAIVPASMSEAIWEDTGIIWSQDGGHVLPLRHPRWCARHVLEFANALPS